MIPQLLQNRAKKKAEELGITFGELLRRSLEDYLDSSYPAQGTSVDVLYEKQAPYEGDSEPDLSAKHDKYLY